MKKKLFCLMLLACLMTVLAIPVKADMGPKPSVVVDISGVEGQYYATLLAEETSTGPWSVSDGLYDPEGDRTAIWQKFHDYSDPDGYHFLGCFAEVTDHEFRWDYYPPERFKLLLYFPETDSFLACDEIMEQYAFDSYFEAELQSAGTLVMQRSYGIGARAGGFLFRLLATIAVELLIALLFGFRGAQLFAIFAVNVFTQLVLNIYMQVHGYSSIFFVYVLEYLVIELVIFLVEALLYWKTLPKLARPDAPVRNPAIYALVANLCSFVMGYVISGWFPQLFG